MYMYHKQEGSCNMIPLLAVPICVVVHHHSMHMFYENNQVLLG